MNVIFDIGIYMLASSTIMVSYFWLRQIKHAHLEYEQMPGAEISDKNQTAKENIAA